MQGSNASVAILNVSFQALKLTWLGWSQPTLTRRCLLTSGYHCCTRQCGPASSSLSSEGNPWQKLVMLRKKVKSEFTPVSLCSVVVSLFEAWQNTWWMMREEGEVVCFSRGLRPTRLTPTGASHIIHMSSKIEALLYLSIDVFWKTVPAHVLVDRNGRLSAFHDDLRVYHMSATSSQHLLESLSGGCGCRPRSGRKSALFNLSEFHFIDFNISILTKGLRPRAQERDWWVCCYIQPALLSTLDLFGEWIWPHRPALT